MTKAAIYYDTVYSRLSPEQKAEHDRIGKKVIVDLDIGGDIDGKYEL